MDMHSGRTAVLTVWEAESFPVVDTVIITLFRIKCFSKIVLQFVLGAKGKLHYVGFLITK